MYRTRPVEASSHLIAHSRTRPKGTTLKWVYLFAGLAAVLPLADWLRRNPQTRPKLWILIGFLPFAPVHVHMALISWAAWPGHVKGVEFSLLDLLVLATYFSLPRTRHFIPFRVPMILYFIAILISATQTDVPMAALFYAWQLARMFLVYATVVRACEDPRVAPSILDGMGIGLCLEAVVAIWERFGQGVLQTGATFGHQNLLGMVSHFVAFPFFALLLSGQKGRWPALVLFSGVIVAVLTTSRATAGLATLGYSMLFIMSALRGWTSRKAKVAMAGAAAVALLVPLAVLSFDSRFAKQVSSENYDERAAFTHAAEMILSDHPLGTGANTYVVVANAQGYNDRAGVAYVAGSESTHVHNVYRLVAAESGYFGLVTFVLVLIFPLTTAFLCGSRFRKDIRGDMLLGFGTSLLVIYVHSNFEWIFITFPAQYLFALTYGMVVGVARKLGYWSRTQTQSVPLGTNSFVASVVKMQGKQHQ